MLSAEVKSYLFLSANKSQNKIFKFLAAKVKIRKRNGFKYRLIIEKMILSKTSEKNSKTCSQDKLQEKTLFLSTANITYDSARQKFAKVV